MSHNPRFSCVMPVKGARPYMDKALRSLDAQGYGGDLEIIVQDGDSEPDSGQGDALNKGFAKACGDWLFWLNADDILLPGALDAVSRLIDGHGEASAPEWIAGDQLIIDESGRVLKCSVGPFWHDWLFRHSVPHVFGPSSFFRSDLLKRAGGLDATLDICLDWDLWIRFMQLDARYRRIRRYVWAQRSWSGSKTQRAIVGEEYLVHQAEIRRMLAKNGFRVTGVGRSIFRLWRFLSGNYAREKLDGFSMSGKEACNAQA